MTKVIEYKCSGLALHFLYLIISDVIAFIACILYEGDQIVAVIGWM